MAKETQKSENKLKGLRNEFGSMVDDWGAEHATEVLSAAAAASMPYSASVAAASAAATAPPFVAEP
jgi:hypothetical protein